MGDQVANPSYSQFKIINIESITSTSGGGNLDVTSYVPSGYIPLIGWIDSPTDLITILPAAKYSGDSHWYMAVFKIASATWERKKSFQCSNVKILCVKA